MARDIWVSLLYDYSPVRRVSQPSTWLKMRTSSVKTRSKLHNNRSQRNSKKSSNRNLMTKQRAKRLPMIRQSSRSHAKGLKLSKCTAMHITMERSLSSIRSTKALWSTRRTGPSTRPRTMLIRSCPPFR